jgi:DNA-binding transcriptional regulator YiaG
MPTCQAKAGYAYLDRGMPMTANQLRSALKRLALTQVAAAVRLGVAPRTMRYWVAGERRIPEAVAILLRTWLKARAQH